MRDALNEFGNITLATANTDVYSATILDLGTIKSGSRFGRHAIGVSGEQAYIMFRATANFSASTPEDGMIPFLRDDENDDMSTGQKIVVGPEITAPTKGTVFALPLPANVNRYIQAGCTPKSDGAFDGAVVEAWIEFGPNVPENAPTYA